MIEEIKNAVKGIFLYLIVPVFVCICFISAIYGLLIAGMIGLSWFLHEGRIFNPYPLIDFYTYAKTTKLMYFTIAGIAGCIALYTIYGKPQILHRIYRRWHIEI